MVSDHCYINNAGVNDMFEFLSDFEVVSEVNGEVFAYVSCRSAGSLWLKPERRLVLKDQRGGGAILYLLIQGATPLTSKPRNCTESIWLKLRPGKLA